MRDAAQRILRRVALLLRARRTLVALAASLALWSGVRLLAPVLGFTVPGFLGVLCPVVGLIVFVWPCPVRWLRVGKRLGVGGKLAGLAAALETPENAFLSLLLPQISFSLWRLIFPEVLAFLPVLFLLGFSFLPLGSAPGKLSSPPPEAPASEILVETAPPSPPSSSPKGAWPRVLPQLPPDFSPTLEPYAQLLAELLGEDVLPEEVWQRLSEEGRLRELAAVLAQAAEGGWTSELRQELAKLVPELSPRDATSTASPPPQEEGNGAAAPGLGVAGAGSPGAELPEEDTASSEGEAEAQREEARTAAEVLMDTEVEEARWAKLEEAEEGLGLGAGWERGEPVEPGPALSPPPVEERLLAQVRATAGPVRQGFALGLPGEIPGEAPPGLPALPPTEAELVLRASDLPPGLREMVRRYFQLLAERGGE